MKKILPLLLVGIMVLTAAILIAKEGMVQCANLIYGGTHTSRCFSDEFLNALQKETCIPTARRFKSVKLESDELFDFPFIMITGEADFYFTAKEKTNLKSYLERGGFMLASAGCSSKEWGRAFRREIGRILPEHRLKPIEMSHPIFHTVRDIDTLELSHPEDKPYLEGLEMNGKLVVVFSKHGLNDSYNAPGCCCCGGNEIKNSLEVNVNILVYALLH